jgi:hypothetical protein
MEALDMFELKDGKWIKSESKCFTFCEGDEFNSEVDKYVEGIGIVIHSKIVEDMTE